MKYSHKDDVSTMYSVTEQLLSYVNYKSTINIGGPDSMIDRHIILTLKPYLTTCRPLQ